jgi:hypothetical protein
MNSRVKMSDQFWSVRPPVHIVNIDPGFTVSDGFRVGCFSASPLRNAEFSVQYQVK